MTSMSAAMSATGSLISRVAACNVDGSRTVITSSSQHAFELGTPFVTRQSVRREFGKFVEPREHRLELSTVDALARIGAHGDALVEPSVRERVIAARDAEAAIQQALDAHDVEADAIELVSGHFQTGDVGDLRREFLETRERRTVEQFRRE